jgi:hypothetical protein
VGTAPIGYGVDLHATRHGGAEHADDVCLASRKRKHALGAAAQEERRVWVLYRLWKVLQVGDLVVLAVERHRFTAE